MYTKQDFETWDSSPIEKIHLKFCKCYLEVNNEASNIVCRAELDRLLLIPIKLSENYEIFCLPQQQR